MSVHPRTMREIHNRHKYPANDCPHCGTGSGRYGQLPPLTDAQQAAMQQLSPYAHEDEPANADAPPRTPARLTWPLAAMVGTVVVLLSVLFVMYVLNAATGPPGVVPSVNAPPMPHPGVTR